MRQNYTHREKSKKKQAAAAIACLLCISLFMGGVFAWRDSTQAFTNIFHSHPTPDVLLHDDFTPKVNKDVYAENTGDVPLFVRIQFAEFMQVGNKAVTVGAIDNKNSWPVHLFETAPGEDGLVDDWNLDGDIFKTSEYYNWYMTGVQKNYLKGVSEIDNITYLDSELTEITGLNGANGQPIAKTLGESEIILMSEYAEYEDLEKLNFTGWILDTDGWAYWSQLLPPGEATSLLLDNVIKIKNPDDNSYYAIDVRPQAANRTEVYKWDKKGITQNAKEMVTYLLNVASDDEEKFDIYLCIGQSNMAGRAEIEPRDCFEIPNTLLFNGTDWEPAAVYAPNGGLNRYNSHNDHLASKLNPALYFANTMQRNAHGRKIGIICDAIGNSSLQSSAWGSPSGPYYNNSVARTKVALSKGGKLRGVIWLQGEADVSRSASYVSMLNDFVDSLRSDLGVTAAECPFIAGEIQYDMTYTVSGVQRNGGYFNSYLSAFVSKARNTDYISAAIDPQHPEKGGLAGIPGDTVHFNSESQRVLGRRYAEKMLKMQSK